jgi:hypothetical protein
LRPFDQHLIDFALTHGSDFPEGNDLYDY